MRLKTSSRIHIFIFLVLGGFLGCENKLSHSDKTSSLSEVDSILIWIESGRNQSNSKVLRKENLVRAFENAGLGEHDSIQLVYFSKIQWSFLGLQDSVWFRKTNKETNLLARKIADSVRWAGSQWDLAVFLNQNGIKDSAYYHFANAQKIFNVLEDNSRAGKLFHDMALIQMEVKDYTGSEINIIKAIELLKPLEDNLMLYHCYNLLGIVAKDLKEYDRSLQYYKIAEGYLEKSGEESRFANFIENNIGVNYLRKGEYEKAISYFESALNVDSLFFKNPISYARTLNNLAQSHYRLISKPETEEIFLRSLKIRDSLEDTAGLAGGYFSLAEYYLFKKDTTKAIESAKKSKMYAEKSHNNERLLGSLELLTQLDPKNASAHGQRYMALNDSLQNEERKLRNKFARIRFETDEVVAENELLARQKQLWTGIAASLLLFGASVFIIINQRVRNQNLRFQQAQQVSNEKIFNLMLSEKQKFEEGKKIEQKRISEELHDGVLGKMLGARMVLTGLNKKDDEEAISERANAILALKDVEGEVRTISHELSHAAYQEIHNFIRSISDLLKNIAGAANINHTFNYNQEVSWDDLRGDIKINLYRIVQESLQNAVKHSRCENIVLDFSAENNELKISIKDDGIGFILNKKKRKGIGMRNLNSRINKLDGKWQIDSKPGKGTSIHLSIPIEFFSEDPQIFDELKKVEKV